MMAAFYAFIFLRIFSYILGGMKIGYLKSSSLMLSQTLALLASNVLIYLETVLLSAKFIPVEAMIVLTFIDVGVNFSVDISCKLDFQKTISAQRYSTVI